MSEQEKIICAAIWYKGFDKPANSPINVSEGVVLCGHRHGHIIGQFKSLTGKRSVITDAGEYEQGFLTDTNRFVGRKEAATIAFLARQISDLRYVKGKTELFSEDLY